MMCVWGCVSHFWHLWDWVLQMRRDVFPLCPSREWCTCCFSITPINLSLLWIIWFVPIWEESVYEGVTPERLAYLSINQAFANVLLGLSLLLHLGGFKRYYTSYIMIKKQTKLMTKRCRMTTNRFNTITMAANDKAKCLDMQNDQKELQNYMAVDVICCLFV